MNRFLKKTAAFFSAAALLAISHTIPVCAYATDALWPTESQYHNITTNFEPARNISDSSQYHNAIDIEANGGSNIYAVYPGTVVSADWKDAYGYIIIIRHADLGIYTFYAHCSQVKVSAGQSVAQGDVIGLVGATGYATGNHLHYGICDNLQSGWPTCTYYDPLTYFTYTDDPSGISDPGSKFPAGFTDALAGVYTTKGIETYLNIRSGNGTNYAVIGKINPGDTVTVTMSDGKWAYVTANGVTGYCSMDYLQKKGEIEAKMTITGQTYPEGALNPGAAFSLKGKITSAYPITKVYGGVYNSDGKPTAQYTEVAVNAATYDLNTYFDKQIKFGSLANGVYIYKVTAEDSKGNTYELVCSEFSIGAPPEKVIAGDANADGKVNIADVITLQKFMTGDQSYSSKQYEASDLDGDGIVNAFDLTLIRMDVLSTLESGKK
ncbi:MAG: peptidoglycan DD-metalloendopeptidase family protein [Ruminococcus sp.]|nr:peptidoglycan DD-metalloendopeptidase family protein [Ruminococcus sp.]